MTIRLSTTGLFLSAALLCSAAQAADKVDNCKYVQIGELPLRYTGAMLELTTDGTINGLRGPLLVDTGAAFSSISMTGAQRRMLVLDATNKAAVGIGGTSRLYEARVKQFSFGPIQTGSTDILVSQDAGVGPDYDGIAGSPHLLQNDMELSLAEKKMRFFSHEGCDDSSFLGYWGGEIFEIPFKRQAGDPRPRFTVEVNGEKMEAIIDSGAQTSLIIARAAKRVGMRFGAEYTVPLGDALGFGGTKAQRWGTLADLKIGAETVRNAELSVLETDTVPDIDIILGDDFLRSHRVLFAMDQKKLYISYVGGQPFKQHTATLAPWILQEAEAGNADAQLMLSSIYRYGRGTVRDPRQAGSWLLKAAANGSWQANILLGLVRVSGGNYDEGIAHLRAGLERQTAARIMVLWWYVTLVYPAPPDAAKHELDEAIARADAGNRRRSANEAILDRIDLGRLFKAATEDKPLARQRGCAASAFIVAMKLLSGDTAQAESVRTTWRPMCTSLVATNSVIAQELELLNKK
jgi:predicted aspartyl protease